MISLSGTSGVQSCGAVTTGVPITRRQKSASTQSLRDTFRQILWHSIFEQTQIRRDLPPDQSLFVR
jgi:hypothetical protein